MMVAGIVIAVILFLLFFPTCIVLQYNTSGFTVYIRLFGLWKLDLTKKTGDSQKKKKTKKEIKPTAEKKEKKKASLSDQLEKIQAIFRIAVNSLDAFCKCFTMYTCKVHILTAGDDPADVALEFGLVNAAVYGIFSVLEEKIKIRKKDICILFDYDSDRSKIEVDFRFRVVLLFFLLILICSDFRDIMTLINNK